MKSNLFTAAMVAPCGLDCSLCKRALAETDPCPGCHGPDENKPEFCSRKCGIILCRKRLENGYTFCDECPDYPCEYVREKETRYTSKYPLYESPAENLRDIRKVGLECFLENQRSKWTCGECGEAVPVHTGICTGCGKQYGARVVQVSEDTWRIENGMVRFFLLKGTEKAILIDSGMTVRHARNMAKALTGLPVLLANTHADVDHVGCNDQFDSFYMHPAEEPGYRSCGKRGQLIPVQDGDELDLGGRRLRIIHIPGHTPGSTAVLDVDRRVLISGDPVQEHGRIFMFGENRNMKDYMGSLEKLDAMKADFDELWPSHGDIPLGTDAIGKLIDGTKKVLRREVAGRTEELFGRKIVAYDLGFTVLLCDN